jgi:hypothetical protein
VTVHVYGGLPHEAEKDVLSTGAPSVNCVLLTVMFVDPASDTPIVGVGLSLAFDGAAALTVRSILSVTPLPSLAAAVIVGEPGAIAVTTPVPLTVASEGSLELQVMLEFVTFPGETVQTSGQSVRQSPMCCQRP